MFKYLHFFRNSSLPEGHSGTALVLLLIFFVQSVSFSEIRYVSKTGLSIPPFLSWETASDSIQKCIDISNSGDTIYVGNGVYKETLIIKRGLALIGSGIDSCIIDTKSMAHPNQYNAVTISDSCLMQNFRIEVSNYNPSNGYWWGTGIRIKGSYIPGYTTTIKNNFIVSCARGILSMDCNSFIENNVIRDNKVAVELTTIFIRNKQEIIANYISSWHCIYISFGSTPYIANNICTGAQAFTGSFSGKNEFYNNLFIVSEGLFFSDTTYFINNVITGNPATGIQLQRFGAIKNNVIINAGRVLHSNIPAYPQIQYNNIWNYNILNTGYAPSIDSTNIFEDPMFVNDTSDFHLQMYSKLIDAGDPEILDIDGSRSDIGLFGGPLGESYTYQDLAPRAPVNVSAEFDTMQIKLKWNKNTESDFFIYRIYRDTVADFQIDSSKLISSQTDSFIVQQTPIGINTLYYKITAVDSQGNESHPSEQVSVILSNVNNNEPVVVYDYKLYQNYPNPFNPSTKIGYRLKERGYVKLIVYDLNGQLVRVLVNENKDRGYYEEEFNAEELSSGIYIYRIDIISETMTPAYSDVKKMILIK